MSELLKFIINIRVNVLWSEILEGIIECISECFVEGGLHATGRFGLKKVLKWLLIIVIFIGTIYLIYDFFFYTGGEDWIR